MLLAWALAAAAQSIPADYLDLYSSLQQKLSDFGTTLSAHWDGSQPPMDFCAELLSANGNRGLQLLGKSAVTGMQTEARSLQAMGVTSISVAINFPVLYRAFYAYNADPNDYQNMLAYYRQVASVVRAYGMRLVVHTGPMYTGVFSDGSNLNAAGYYKSFPTVSAYVAARAEQIVTIAQEIQPDALVLADEPDNEATLTGQPSLAVVSGFSSMIDTFLSRLDQFGYNGTYVGAGVGTWLDDAPAFIAALAAKPRLNFLTLGMSTINGGLLDTGVTLIDQALASGKPVALSPGWLEKRADSEYPAADIGWNPTIDARNPYSFWAPLDQQFLTEMVQLGWWKHAAMVSVFWSNYLDAYLAYGPPYTGFGYDQLMSAFDTVAATAMQNGTLSSTGDAWQALIAPPASMPALVSAANPRATTIAPNSIVSVFGKNLAGSSASMSPPLPTALIGTTLTFNQAGNSLGAPLYYVSASQVNAVVPGALSPGPATFQIAGQSGLATIATVAPALFTANGNGIGPASAYVSRLLADGSTTIEQTVNCAPGPTCTNAAIDVSAASGKVTLVLFGTGIRGRGDLSDVQVSVGGALEPVTYAGPQSQYPGMDQVNVTLPASLAGRGVANLSLVVAGRRANVVTIAVK